MMKFRLFRTNTSLEYSESIEFKTIEELINFVDKQNCPLIINPKNSYDWLDLNFEEKYFIEIYDDYRE